MTFFQNFKIFFLDKNEKSFYNFISKIFQKQKFNNNSIVLVENVNNRIHHIPYIYLIHNLVKKYSSKVCLYSPNQSVEIKRIIYNFLLIIKKPFFTKIISNLFKSEIVINHVNYVDYKKKNLILKKIKNKNDFYNLKIFNIHFGDLLYDHYLKKFRVPTVNVQNKHFKKYMENSLENIFFWYSYFKKNKIKSLIVSHAVYWNGIPARIAISKNIPVYALDINNAFYLSKKINIPYKKFINYKKNFQKYSNKDKIKFRKLSDRRLKLRMSGRIGVDMSYSTKSAWRKTNSKKNILTNKKKIKILVSAHCFFDSPNGMGKNLFVDFYEWIKFLGKISHETDYIWYIKTHPDFLPGNKEIIKELTSYFKNIKILPSHTSHHNIIDSGINFVLTVYGTVALEYAYNNIPVINASINNPNINYNYNIHPKTIKDYKKIIKNLTNIKIKINKNEILENYYLHNLKKENNIYFNNTSAFNEKFSGIFHSLESDLYQYCMTDFTDKNHNKIIKMINNFVNSKKYSLEI